MRSVFAAPISPALRIAKRLQKSPAEEQTDHRPKKQETERDSDDDDGNEDEEHADNKKPIALPRRARAEPVSLDDLVIARIRFEPNREGIAADWDDADAFVGKNVESHSDEKNFRDA